MAETETNRAYRRAYRAAHREEINAYKRAYRAANPGQGSAAVVRWKKAHPERMQAYRAKETARELKRLEGRRWRGTPLGQYIRQRSRAKARGIVFLLTFEEWWTIWQESGKWDQRGKTKGAYVMARFGDQGPYAADNIRICTVAENGADRRGIHHGPFRRDFLPAAPVHVVPPRCHRSLPTSGL